ncbi:MAG: hypothetical protein ACTSXA_14385 [Candidatus Heimdallarchaeota archaeon]
MDEKKFKDKLTEWKMDKETISKNIEYVKKYEEFLPGKDTDKAAIIDFEKYITQLMNLDDKEIKEHLYAIYRYYFSVNNKEFIIALGETMDGTDVFQNLYDEVEKELGKEIRDKIFAGVELPKPGADQKAKVAVTKVVMDRMDELVEPEKRNEIMSSGLHRLGKDGLKRMRDVFLEADDIDDFLEKRQEALIERLEGFRDRDELWFTQPINDDVVEYVRKNPTIEYGVREGDKVITTKIPYQTIKWLNETDPIKKKYHYCHCFWVRESLKKEDSLISPSFCYCSAGFYKQQWDAILDQPIKVEMLESVLKGDPVCKFAINLPKDIVEKVERKKE